MQHIDNMENKKDYPLTLLFEKMKYWEKEAQEKQGPWAESIQAFTHFIVKNCRDYFDDKGNFIGDDGQKASFLILNLEFNRFMNASIKIQNESNIFMKKVNEKINNENGLCFEELGDMIVNEFDSWIKKDLLKN